LAYDSKSETPMLVSKIKKKFSHEDTKTTKERKKLSHRLPRTKSAEDFTQTEADFF
jgi:hypothetical protein